MLYNETGGTFLSRITDNRRLPARRLDPFDLAALLLLAALVVTALLVFRHYAISNDEEAQHHYGELIIAYYASGFTDLRLFDYRNLYLYGGLFDIVAILLGRMLPVDVFVIRHVLCALIGIGGIAAAWATARLIAGPRAGLLAALALAICGPWFGAMFNHTKDVPFAAAMMGAIYFLCRAARALPSPRAGDVIGFGLLLGVALGLRAVGLLLVIYALLAIALRLPTPATSVPAARFAVQSLAALMPALVLGYLIMIAAWPWAALELLNPARAIFAFANFHYEIRTILSGSVYEMAQVPRSYVPTYLAIKLPLVMLFGAALALLLIAKKARAPTEAQAAGRRRETVFIAFVAAFPVLCQVIGRGPAFTGLRHFLFVVPPLAVLVGVGLDGLLGWLEEQRRAWAMGAFAAIIAWHVWDASVLARLHPYEYLFYNQIVGGLEGATRLYVTDYWVNIMPEAVDKLEAYVARLRQEPDKRFTVAVCGERLPFEKKAHAPLQWSKDWDTADFYIAPTHMNCDRVLNGMTIVAIERFGALIGVVKDLRGVPVEARWAPVAVARK